MSNGTWIEWLRTELDGPDDFDNFKTEMKRSCEQYNIKLVDAQLTEEGKVFEASPNFPYEEVKDIHEKSVWVVRHKETGQLRIAKYLKVADGLDFLSTFTWRKMRQFNHLNIVNGVEAFYDPQEKLFIHVVEFCYCKYTCLINNVHFCRWRFGHASFTLEAGQDKVL